jgi:proline iminopeptidase
MRIEPLIAVGLMACAHERTVPAGDAQLWVHVEGGGASDARTLVLLHGGPGGTSRYLAALDALASPSLRVVRYDQRGSGRSSAPAGGDYGRDAFVRDLQAVLDAVGAGKVTLLAHSWGGMVVQEFAAAHPDEIAGLILVAATPPSSSAFATAEKARDRHFAEAAARGLIPRSLPSDCAARLRALRPAMVADPRSADDPAFDPTGCSTAARDAIAAAHLATAFDYRAALAALDVPALVVVGDRDPSGRVAADASADALRHARQAIIRDCGHFPWIEQPEKFSQAVKQFLEIR